MSKFNVESIEARKITVDDKQYIVLMEKNILLGFSADSILSKAEYYDTGSYSEDSEINERIGAIVSQILHKN